MDFASSYDQTIAIHAIYIIHTLWWRLNEDGEDADDMLREVSQRWNTLDGGGETLGKPRSCSAPARSSWRSPCTTRPSTQTSTGYFGAVDQQLRVADVGDYIQSRIGWRVMVPTAERRDNMLDLQHDHLISTDGLRMEPVS